MRRILTLFFGLSVVLVACGQQAQPDSAVADLGGSTSDLLFWSDLDADRSSDRPDSEQPPMPSYLVAFKRDAVALQAGQLAPQSSRSQRRFLQYVSPLIGQTRDLTPLATLNMTRPLHTMRPNRNHPLQMRSHYLRQDIQRPAFDEWATIAKVDFATEAEARTTLSRWYAEGKVLYAEPNHASHLSGELEDRLINDFSDSSFYPWLDQIDFVRALQFIAPSPPLARPIVAVMDSGVDVFHDALIERVYLNDQGQNKLCRDDVYGCNTTVSSKELLGDGNAFPAGTDYYGRSCNILSGNCWHGTHVAGIIAADGGAEFTGVCPYCRILNVKVVDLDVEGESSSFVIKDSSIIAGLAYVSGFTNGTEPLVRVINASFGKFQRSRSVELFIRALRGFGKGILVVAAAGNEDTMKRQYPAGFDDVLAVANVRSDRNFPKKSASSNFGMWVDIAAPGDGDCPSGISTGIYSSIPGNAARCLPGTSMASPMVAGIAGLILATEPDLSFDALVSRLIQSSVPDNLYKDGVNNAYRPNIEGQQLVPLLGSGIVNAYYALNPGEAKTPPVLTEKADVVSPGCSMVGLAATGAPNYLVWALLLAPLTFILKRRR